MTEKRYTHNILGSVFKDGKLFALTDGESQARTLCIELNELNDENKQLKNMVRHSYVEHKRCVNNYVDKIKEVEKENEQLKSKNRGLQSELQIFKEDVTHSNLQINKLADENEQLKQDVDYWKQVASQYSNELNVFEHCKKYKTECKDIYWSSD